jgi:hypothetical protein
VEHKFFLGIVILSDEVNDVSIGIILVLLLFLIFLRIYFIFHFIITIIRYLSLFSAGTAVITDKIALGVQFVVVHKYINLQIVSDLYHELSDIKILP